MPTIAASNRQWSVSVADDGSILEVGPGAAIQRVGTLVIQFNPRFDYSGQIKVQGRLVGKAAQSLSMPPSDIPYRRVSLGGLASDRTLVSDLIIGPAIIEVPANGLSICLDIHVVQGICDIALMDLEGPAT